jgi:hypothetical protein
MRLRFAVMLAAVSVWLAHAPAASAAVPAEEVRRIVVQEALRGRLVPPSLALAVAEAESDFQADAESPAGARGVMQIMPRTARTVFDTDPDELWNPRLNAQLGVAFLEQLIERYGGRWEQALAHYNGGTRAGRGDEAEQAPETRDYVRKVMRLYRRNDRDATVAALVRQVGDRNPSLRLAGASAAGPSRDDTADDGDRPIWSRDRAAAERRERLRAYLAKAEAALDGAGRALADAGSPADALLAAIEDTRLRFRTLLARAAPRLTMGWR